MSRNMKYQAMLLGCMVASGSVMAQVSVWQGGAGDWSVGANWNTAAVPTLADETHIYNNGGGEVATVYSNNAVSARLVMENGAGLMITNGGNLNVEGQAMIGNAPTSVGATITVDGGTFDQGTGASKEFYLGSSGGGILVVTNNGTANLGHFAVGVNGGDGLVTIDSGTVNVNGAWLMPGYTPGSTGNIVLNGGALNTSATTALNLGLDGTGSVTNNGGTVTASGPVVVGVNATGVGELVVDAGTFNAAGTFALGQSGTGALTVNGGTLNANGPWLIPGYLGGSTGDIIVNGGELNAAGTLYVGFDGDGSLTVTGGVVNVGTLVVANGAGSVGDVDIDGGQVIVNGGFVAGANSTFYIGFGELIFNGGQTLGDVQALVSGPNWIFDDIPYVYDSGSGIVVTSMDSASVPFPALAEDVKGPELIPNADFASMTNNVDNPGTPSDLWYVTGSKGDLWEWYEGYADLVDWSFYYADPDNVTPLVGTAGAQDVNTNAYPLDGTTLLDTWIDGTHVILSSCNNYLNGMKSEDILNGATINPAGTYKFEISGFAQVDNTNATLTAALTAGADATNTANAVSGSLIQAPIADLSNTLTVQLSGADLTNGQVNVMFHVENTDPIPGVAEGSNALIRAHYRSTPPNSQTWFTSITLHETIVPEAGDVNRDGFLSYPDVELANAYLDGSIDGGADAAARQAYWIGEGMTPAEALAHLNLTEFDLNGDNTFDAADVAILESLAAPFIEEAVMNGSGHFEVEVSRLGVGVDYYLMRTPSLSFPSYQQVDQITAASETDTLTDTNAPGGAAFYKVTK